LTLSPDLHATDFELFQRFKVKLDLIKLCSISLVATAIENSPELNCGQGVLHGALQTLHYGHIDMHKLTPKIQEVIAFTVWLTDKIQQKCAKSGICVT
jgi:hypothetical protein